MTEKRNQARFKMYQMIQMTVGKEEYVACEGINISKTGMLCRIDRKIDHAAQFYLLFEVPLQSGNYEISCEGMVAHSHKTDDGYEIGVHFTDLFEDDERILETYLAELAQKTNSPEV